MTEKSDKSKKYWPNWWNSWFRRGTSLIFYTMGCVGVYQEAGLCTAGLAVIFFVFLEMNMNLHDVQGEVNQSQNEFNKATIDTVKTLNEDITKTLKTVAKVMVMFRNKKDNG